MYKLEVKEERQYRIATFAEMKEGEIGRIIGGGYSGQIVMRRYNKVFSLGRDNSYWGIEATHQVEILPSGTKIEITVQ